MNCPIATLLVQSGLHLICAKLQPLRKAIVAMPITVTHGLAAILSMMRQTYQWLQATIAHRGLSINRTQSSTVQYCATICSVSLISLMVALPTATAQAAELPTRSHAPQNARAYLIEPTNGQTVEPEFVAKFGLSGMDIAPAGIQKAGTGHHHLLIDLEALPSLSEPLPANANIKHFGKGQTESVINLAPGQHTLQLLLGDYAHTPHDNPVISEKVTITVK